MGKQNTHRIDPFDAICMTARRSPTRGKIGNFVAQMTTPGFANCTSPSNPRQQVRRYVKTPYPASIRQQWIALALRESWGFFKDSSPRLMPQIESLFRQEGFYFRTLRPNDSGGSRVHSYKAGIRGELVRSFIREITRDVPNFGDIPFTPDYPRLFTITDEFDLEDYRQTLRTLNFGLN